MTEPLTRFLPAVGAITYESDTAFGDRTFLARIFKKRGVITATIPPSAEQGPGAKLRDHVFDVYENQWQPIADAFHPEVIKVLAEAIGWFNGESGNLTTAHRLLALKPLPYDVANRPPLPAQQRSAREGWWKMVRWLDAQGAPAPDALTPVSFVGTAFEKVATALAALPRPVPIRLSLLHESFEGGMLLHMIVPEASMHSQVFLSIGAGLFEIDPKRRVGPARHRRELILSQALAVVSGLGMFLTDPQTRIRIVVETGDPAENFPRNNEAEILVGGGDFLQTLRDIETAEPDRLATIAGVSLAGKL